MALSGLVEGRGDDFGVDLILHVRDLLGPLVDEQHDQMHVGLVDADRIGDLLKQHGLARLRRGHDQASLTFPDRGDEVEDTHGERAFVARHFELQPMLRVARPEILEAFPILRVLRVEPVHGLDFEKSQVPFATLRGTNLPPDHVASTQVEALDLGRTYVDVVGTVEIIPVLRTEESVPFSKNLEHSFAAKNHLSFEQALLDFEDQILLAEAGEVADVQLFREAVEIPHALVL